MGDDQQHDYWRNLVRRFGYLDLIFTGWYLICSGFILIRTFLFNPEMTLELVGGRKGVNVTGHDPAFELNFEVQAAVLTGVVSFLCTLYGLLFFIALAGTHVMVTVGLINLTKTTESLDGLHLVLLTRVWLTVTILFTGIFPGITVSLSVLSNNSLALMVAMAIIYAVFRGLWMFSVWKFMGGLKAAAAASETGRDTSGNGRNAQEMEIQV